MLAGIAHLGEVIPEQPQGQLDIRRFDRIENRVVLFLNQVEPLPGRYPLPGIGPFALLQETEMNHWGKMMFKWIYWNMLIRGKELPLPHEMLMAGKITIDS